MTETLTREDAEHCRAETLQHIRRVQFYLSKVAAGLLERGVAHDQSKLEEPEFGVFASVTPRLRGLTYGTDEYRAALADLGPALKHHYENNSHHPEHYANGIRGMDLLDIVEMCCDWLAATERHADGDIMRSIDINETRFDIPPALSDILRNTVRQLKP